MTIDGDPLVPKIAASAPFILQFTAPAGFPWDQRRAVELEALHCAPLPADELMFDLRRLDPWRPGREAGYICAYFRRDELPVDQRVSYAFEGQAFDITIRDPDAPASARTGERLSLVLSAGAAVLLTCMVFLAVEDRRSAEAAFDQLEAEARRKIARGKETERRLAEARALDQAGQRNAQLSTVLADIVWLSRARSPAASITAVTWRPDAFSIEAAGQANPIAGQDRAVTAAGATGGSTLWSVRPGGQREETSP